MYSNNILNFQESTTILSAHTKKSGNLLKSPRIIVHKLGTSDGVMVNKLNYQTFTNEFESLLVNLLYSLVLHLSKNLCKLLFIRLGRLG